MLDDANGDVTAAINLGIAQDQSEGRVHQQIKADHKAAQLDSPQKTEKAAPGVIDLTGSPMETPKEDTECLYVGTKQPRPTSLGASFTKASKMQQQDPPTLSELFAQETKRQATATSTMQGLEERLRVAYEQDQKVSTVVGMWWGG